jgi:hypothetical protein
MKEEVSLVIPFIGDPRCGREAIPCGQKLSNLSPRCGGCDKGEDSRRERREKMGKVAGWP